MSKIMLTIGTLFFILSVVSFCLTVWLLWNNFSFWKLIADLIATSVGVFWGIVIVLLSKKFGH